MEEKVRERRQIKRRGYWKPGQSGNPAGAKPGYKQKRTILREALMANPRLALLDPFDFLLEILSCPSYGLQNRKWAAMQLLPYTRSKMPIKVETTQPADDHAAKVREALAAIEYVTVGQEEQPARRRVKLSEDV